MAPSHADIAADMAERFADALTSVGLPTVGVASYVGDALAIVPGDVAQSFTPSQLDILSETMEAIVTTCHPDAHNTKYDLHTIDSDEQQLLNDPAAHTSPEHFRVKPRPSLPPEHHPHNELHDNVHHSPDTPLTTDSMSDDDLHEWSHKTVEMIGTAITGWLNKEIDDVGWNEPYQEHPTANITSQLLLLNQQANVATTFSQPGYITDDEQHRAAVWFIAPRCLAKHFSATAFSAGLISINMPFTIISDDDFHDHINTATVPISQTTAGDPSNWASCHNFIHVNEALSSTLEEQWTDLLDSYEAFLIVDPIWGREHHLWDTLTTGLGLHHNDDDDILPEL